ncbi:MAG TPA: hypothetical protein PLF84_00145 [Bryobacteraceae bacterium]|jgi:hypothetical protein|nr:hypothetical protein [Bryobacterales bacterium]HRJ17412.1 hypothetical protein [Bryobacteraceae bacterium]
MGEKTITVEIDEQGNSSIDLHGFHGKGCGDVAEALRDKDTLVVDRKKREFHVTAAESRVVRNSIKG